MKIAIFHCGFIYSGGGERIVLEEARELMRRGHEVVVRAPTLDRQKCFPDMLEGLDIETFLPQLPGWFRGRYAVQMMMASLLAPFLAVFYRDFDVFLGANQPGAWMARWMSLVLRKPYVVYLNQPNRLLYPREVDQETGWVNERSYQALALVIWLFRFLVKPLDRWSFTGAKTVLVNGSYIGGVIAGVYRLPVVDCPAGAYGQSETLLLKRGGAYRGKVAIESIRNGSAKPRTKKQWVIDKPYILLTNRHDPQKKFEYVIETMAQLKRRESGTHRKRKGGGVKLVVPGPFTRHTPVLLALARKLGVTNRVLFLGQITEASLQTLYRQAAVYVYPSPQEDFGLGPLEAGAWGVPTVAWENAGPTVTVMNGKTGFLAQPFEVGDMAEKLERVLQDPDLQYRLGRAAWRRVRDEFSWERHGELVEKAVSY